MNRSPNVVRHLRPVLAPLTVLTLLLGALALVVAPPGGPPPAEAATRVAKDDCRRIDPNLVNGVCLRYPTPRGSSLTWIGTYRAPNGKVFFCIDFLYDSRLPAKADTVSTARLVNQLGDAVGGPEVAALNYLVSTWAGRGSTGSDDRDAAIALIVREVMDDGTRPGGVVVYPGDLTVGDRVRAPLGGLGGDVMTLARSMWREASRSYGPWQLSLRKTTRGPMRLGQARDYRVEVVGASGRAIVATRVQLDCRGPITCPRGVSTKRGGALLRVRPSDTGRYRIRASVAGPDSDGLLYRHPGWHTHGGSAARAAGVQRGWIAQDNRVRAVATERTTIEKARPQVTTRTSAAVAKPGELIHDVVTVSGLPEGYDEVVVADLYGPYDERPGPDDCVESTRAGRVRLQVDGNGTFTTPAVPVAAVGFYTWAERFRGDRYTKALTTRCGIAEETTVVEPFTPRVRTEASRQRAQVGDAVRDRVEVTGLRDTETSLTWVLHGPRRPVDGSCADVSWDAAPVADQGSLAIAGDGTRRTPITQLDHAGCYTYSQRVEATSVSTEAVSQPGLARETTLVRRRTPIVTTRVSDQRALVGDRIRDEIYLTGLRAADRVRVEWWLHGPIAPAAGGSCNHLDWDDAPVADSGEQGAVGDGTYRTRRVRVRVAGCYTYSERLRATDETDAARTQPGLRSETSLVTRPPVPVVPEIPSGFDILTTRSSDGADDTDAAADRPTTRATPRYLDRRYVAPEPAGQSDLLGRSTVGAQLRIPSVGIRAGVSTVGLDGATMAVPNDTQQLGWLAGTASVEDVIGASVISGHVSDASDRPGALWRLREVGVGDVVRWSEGGTTRRFVVSDVAQFPRTTGVPARYFRTTGPHVLHLVTCTDKQATTTGFHYADNLVVTAKALS